MIEEIIYKNLQNIVEVEGRVYPQVGEENPKLPFIIFHIINGSDKLSKNKNRKLVEIEYRIQIDIFDNTSLSTKKIRDKVKQSLYSLPSRVTNLTFRDAYEVDTKIYRQIIEFKYKTGECNDN